MRTPPKLLVLTLSILLIGGGAWFFSHNSTTVRVFELAYYPLAKDGVNLDKNETGFDMTLAQARTRVSEVSRDFIDAMQQATTYVHDSNKKPSLTHSIIKSEEILEPLPRSSDTDFPNYRDILLPHNICSLVDSTGVREVWIWRYHGVGTINLNESNMAMGTLSQTHWNHATYGDISNSNQSDDLPTCAHTYTVYEFNYSRGLGEALENYGHQLERLFGEYADPDLFWNHFVRPHGNPELVNACGWVHSPPNTQVEYDWHSPATVRSNCDDWHPDGTGTIGTVNCATWGCGDDGGVGFKIWWMQHMPGRNNTLSFKGRPLRNWWELVGDFDRGAARSRTLYR